LPACARARGRLSPARWPAGELGDDHLVPSERRAGDDALAACVVRLQAEQVVVGDVVDELRGGGLAPIGEDLRVPAGGLVHPRLLRRCLPVDLDRGRGRVIEACGCVGAGRFGERS
jgi:hypothetical protein